MKTDFRTKREFIVINKKHLEEIRKKYPITYELFIDALEDINSKLKKHNKYYVCNQDEPYAQKVIEVILEGERLKEK